MRLNNRHLQIQHTNVQLRRHIATNLHPAVRTCISAPRCPTLLPHGCAFAAFAAQDLFVVPRPAACSAHVASLSNSALPRLNAPQQSTSANSTHQPPTLSSYRHQPAPSCPSMHLRASLPQVAEPWLRFRSICNTGLVCPSHDQRPAVRTSRHCPAELARLNAPHHTI